MAEINNQALPNAGLESVKFDKYGVPIGHKVKRKFPTEEVIMSLPDLAFAGKRHQGNERNKTVGKYNTVHISVR